MLKNERAFLNQYFKRNNGKKVIENMMKKFYDVIVV